jgi:hypothetical protein
MKYIFFGCNNLFPHKDFAPLVLGTSLSTSVSDSALQNYPTIVQTKIKVNKPPLDEVCSCLCQKKSGF